MGRYASRMRLACVRTLPDEIMHVIFNQLELNDKINAGIVCRHWEQLLRAGSLAAEHWIVDYNDDVMASTQPFMIQRMDVSSQTASTCTSQTASRYTLKYVTLLILICV